MVRGVEFEILQQNTNALWQILKCINIKDYQWYVIDSQEEVWTEKDNEDFFEVQYFLGKDFAQKVQDNHNIVFLKLQAYFSDGKFSDIQTYDEFLKGNGQIIVLVNDCEFVEIYCKDVNLSKRIYDHALSQKYKNIEYITDDNDHRTTMNVL